jgi:hypothetical protein
MPPKPPLPSISEISEHLMESLGDVDDLISGMSSKQTKGFLQRGNPSAAKAIMNKPWRNEGGLKIRMAISKVRSAVKDLGKRALQKAGSDMSEEDAMHVVFGAVLSKIHLSSELSQIES